MKDCPFHELTHVLRSLGLDVSNLKNKVKDTVALKQGVQVLLDYHLRGCTPNLRMDIMGEMLFNGGLLHSVAL